MATPESLGDGKPSSRPRTQRFVTKRAHRKSRAGCRGCKQRKIKCDESRPQCTYCNTHELQCNYSSVIVISSKSESSDGIPEIVWNSRSNLCSPESSVSLFPNWDANDIRLLHHYSRLTSGSLFLINRHGADRIVAFEIPRLAFEHDFIRHCVLGIASLHLNHLAPNIPEHQSLTIAHRVKALSGLRVAISQLSKESHRAILAGSLLLLILSSDLSTAETGGDLWIGNWLGLWAGLREIVRVLSWTFVEQSGLEPIFARDNNPQSALTNLPSALSDMLLSMEPDNEDTSNIISTLSCLSRLYQYLLLNGLTEELTTRVIAWPANTDVAEFAVLVKRKQPQALVIAAYYLVFTKLINEIWWMADISGREIEMIAKALPIKYQPLMIIPLQAVRLQSKWDIASLLLSQLPGGSPYEYDLNCAAKPVCGRARELLPVEEVG